MKHMPNDFAIYLFSRMGDPGSENVRLGFYFADLIIVSLSENHENWIPRKFPAILLSLY